MITSSSKMSSLRLLSAISSKEVTLKKNLALKAIHRAEIWSQALTSTRMTSIHSTKTNVGL